MFLLSKYAIKNLKGNIQREYGYSLDYLHLQLVTNPEGNFKNCAVENNLLQDSSSKIPLW